MPSARARRATMPESRALRTDVLILGGGIAGLWTLTLLRERGIDAWLLDTALPGGVQTLASQGIIHGGAKYALGGQLTASARAIAGMPALWRARLAGDGAPDLSALRVLASHQYLWSTHALGSRLAGFFAEKLMRERMEAVDTPPAGLDAPEFVGQIYRLDEPVLDVPHLQRLLLAANRGRVIAPLRLDALDAGARQLHGAWRGERLRIDYERLVLAAGAGNGPLRERLGLPPRMQRRPLHMVMARGRLPALHAHCLGAGANPRLTITSYPLSDGRMLWYLGGQLAEDGVGREPSRQRAVARETLAELLPWIAQRELQWASWAVDRAEIENHGRRPERPALIDDGVVLTLWPTKLAFAPLLAAQVAGRLAAAIPARAGEPFQAPAPPCAPPPWERVKWHPTPR